MIYENMDLQCKLRCWRRWWFPGQNALPRQYATPDAPPQPVPHTNNIFCSQFIDRGCHDCLIDSKAEQSILATQWSICVRFRPLKNPCDPVTIQSPTIWMRLTAAVRWFVNSGSGPKNSACAIPTHKATCFVFAKKNVFQNTVTYKLVINNLNYCNNENVCLQRTTRMSWAGGQSGDVSEIRSRFPCNIFAWNCMSLATIEQIGNLVMKINNHLQVVNRIKQTPRRWVSIR